MPRPKISSSKTAVKSDAVQITSIIPGRLAAKTKPITSVERQLSNTTASSRRSNFRAETHKLLWEEDFSRYTSTMPDPNRWNIADGSLPIYNNEAQKYSTGSDTVSVEGGALRLQAHNRGGQILSGRVDTRNKLSISVGTRLEATIKLPRGKGVWPAFWMLSQNQPHTSALRPTDADWAKERFYLWDGEIDIMEHYGRHAGVVESTLHTYGRSIEKNMKLPDPAGWHTYWMEWRTKDITFGVNETVLMSVPANDGDLASWPLTSNNKYYVILNLAMGGTGGGPIVSAADDRWRMDISRVAAYQL